MRNGALVNDESRKRGRPPSKPNLDAFLKAIADGTFDDDLARIQGVCKNRDDVLKQQVLDLVHEVFGPDAQVQIPRVGEERRPRGPQTMKKNPFLEKSKAETPQDPQVRDDDEPVPDQLEDATLQAINSGEEIPLHLRGAIIGGLTAADMGE
jgi:hypothetical protein